ncbi:MAG: glycosyltransferase [Anaerolineae bacterium]|nr:glycosyltransferase [Anaerolineae bacterium]
MRVLHVTPYYAPAYAFGGVTRAVEGLTLALARAGHEVLVLTTDAGSQNARLEAPPEETRGGVRVVRVPNLSVRARGRFNLSTPLGMRRRAERLLAGVDVVHCHEFRTLDNWLVTPPVRRLNLPLVLSPHGTLTLQTGRGGLKALWDRLLSPAMARRFAAVVGLAEAETDDARAAWSRFAPGHAPHFLTIPNGVDLETFAALPDGRAFRARYGLGDAPVCLFLGRLHPRKGVEALTRAFLAANLPAARLILAGPDDGALAAVQPLIAGDPRVVLTGYLDDRERLEALAAADLFALPAVGEGLPMAALEAMASGLPVILSPGCNLPEAAERDAGLVVEAAVEPLAAALWLLLTDRARRVTMGTNARALVRDRFTWDQVAGQYVALYATLKADLRNPSGAA